MLRVLFQHGEQRVRRSKFSSLSDFILPQRSLVKQRLLREQTQRYLR